jgi:hypothetical protein
VKITHENDLLLIIIITEPARQTAKPGIRPIATVLVSARPCVRACAAAVVMVVGSPSPSLGPSAIYIIRLHKLLLNGLEGIIIHALRVIMLAHA